MPKHASPQAEKPKQTLRLYDRDARKLFGSTPGRRMKVAVTASLADVGIDEWDGRARATLSVHRIAAARIARKRGLKR